MTAEEVLRLQNATPFRPYDVLLSDGRALEIKHPDFLSVSEDEQLIRFYELPDGLEIVDLLLVVSLRVPVSAQSSKQ